MTIHVFIYNVTHCMTRVSMSRMNDIRFSVKGSHVGEPHSLKYSNTFCIFSGCQSPLRLFDSRLTFTFCRLSLFTFRQEDRTASVQVAVVVLINIIYVRALIFSKELQKCQHLVSRLAQCSTNSHLKKGKGFQREQSWAVLVMGVLSQSLW